MKLFLNHQQIGMEIFIFVERSFSFPLNYSNINSFTRSWDRKSHKILFRKMGMVTVAKVMSGLFNKCFNIIADGARTGVQNPGESL